MSRVTKIIKTKKRMPESVRNEDKKLTRNRRKLRSNKYLQGED